MKSPAGLTINLAIEDRKKIGDRKAISKSDVSLGIKKLKQSLPSNLIDTVSQGFLFYRHHEAIPTQHG